LLVFSIDAFWLEPSSLRLTRYTIALPQAPAALRGLKIAVISDLHGGAPYIDIAKIDAVVAMANSAKPDLILLLGDYVGHFHGRQAMPIGIIAAHLKRLAAPLGVYAVLGNHDHIMEGADRVRAGLEGSGIPVLRNAHLAIRGPRGVFDLAGIDDADSHHADPVRALAGIAAGAATLCFTHSPDIFPTVPPDCALTIAGHTHGGQLVLPLIGRPLVPSRYGQRYAKGIIRQDGRTLFVSTGIGTSVLPIRFGVPPEVSFLTLD
jgi:uncharacterized protein